MMRAIGAKKSVLLRLYLVEILLIFARSLPWTVLQRAAVFGNKIGN
ncbi:MAG TPA: hypothetical protein H9683_05825 [Firmicutes bacterium]|nr:hypothetical protein [Bacillota bacterium]